MTTHTTAPVADTGKAFSDDLSAAIRERFHHVDTCPVTGEPRIFFESGGGSLKLKAAIAANADISAFPDQEGRENPASKFLSSLIQDARDALWDYFGAMEGQVIAGETGTELLYRFVRAVCLTQPDGPVVSSALEHPATFDSARQWAERTGRRWIDVGLDPQTGLVTPDHYAAAVTPDTRLATVIHTSQLTGMRVDLPGIVAAIRSVAPDCFVIVDGIQHAPHGALDVAASGADAYIFSPYKTYSRVSAGFAWMGERLIAVPHERMLGASDRLWEFGTRDMGMHAAQAAVIAYFEWLAEHLGTTGPDRRAKLLAAGAAMAGHERALIHRLVHGDGENTGLADTPAVRLIGPMDSPAREGIMSFTVDGMSAPDVVARLADHGIRIHARQNDAYSGHILGALGMEDCVRVSLCHYNTPGEVSAFLKAMRAILG